MSLAKQIGYKRGTEMANEILKATDEMRAWAKLLQSKDENIELKALIYLSNRAYGMPAQEVKVESSEGYRFGLGDKPAANNSAEPIQ